MSGRSNTTTFQERRTKRMKAIDQMTPDLRVLVNDYGLHVVTAFIQHGIDRPRAIRHIVETVLDEFSPTRGSFSAQGIRTMHEDQR